MEPKRTATWVAHYRLLTSLSVLAGVAVFVLGLYLGLAQSVTTVLTGGGSLTARLGGAIGAARPVPLVAGLVLGVLLWRVGDAFAYYATTRKVVDDRIDDHLEEKLGPAIEEELERQVEYRVEEALANREEGDVESMLAESEPDRDTSNATDAALGVSTGNEGRDDPNRADR